MTKMIKNPNILDKIIVQQFINGNYKSEALALGIAKDEFVSVYGKPSVKDINAQKSFQDILVYYKNEYYEEGEPFFTFWFEGTKDLKRKQYRLRTIEFVYPHIKQFTEEFMKDMLGQPDLEYRSGYQMHYCYGNVIFMFTEIKHKWILTNIRYQDDAYKEAHRILFDK